MADNEYTGGARPGLGSATKSAPRRTYPPVQVRTQVLEDIACSSGPKAMPLLARIILILPRLEGMLASLVVYVGGDKHI